MSDTSNSQDNQEEIEAVGVDPDFVTTDHDPEPDDLPSTGEGEDDVDVADLP
ncbi:MULTISPECIES: hypothetical protein [Microbacterium]|uniref:hypothetical protein n=1 Tax=Microbacterium TaxID=33882 RepID=UPI001359D642|nr:MULTISPECIES: hypothetical protein [Microbacterium]